MNICRPAIHCSNKRCARPLVFGPNLKAKGCRLCSDLRTLVPLFRSSPAARQYEATRLARNPR